MATTRSEDVQSRRQALLTQRDECLAKMTPAGRRAYEREQQLRVESAANDAECGADAKSDNSLVADINNLIADADRLRQGAEHDGDFRGAMRALDTGLRGLLLRGKATGEITTARRLGKTGGQAVPSREEGIRIAGELLVALATESEISELLLKLQERRRELTVSAATTIAKGDTRDDLSPAQLAMAEASSGRRCPT